MGVTSQDLKRVAARTVLFSAALTAMFQQLALAATPVAPVQATQTVDPTEIRQTVGGVLRVVTLPDYLGKVLMFDKQPIKELEDDFINIGKSFRIGSDDVVLVSSNCGGSSCTTNSWYFLTVTPKGKLSLSEYIFAGDDPLVQLNGHQITFTSVEQDGRRKKTKVWVFENGKVRQQQ